MFLQVQIVCKENIINFFITIILDKDKKYIKDMLLNSLSNQLNANRKMLCFLIWIIKKYNYFFYIYYSNIKEEYYKIYR